MSATHASHTPNSPTQRNPDSPKSPVRFPFLIPSPIVTRRTRTSSLSSYATDKPQKTGEVEEFCKRRGHGFIIPDDGAERIFVHVSDIEGEYVPCKGDHVSYKECPIPPKRTKVQAVDVVITHLAPGTKHHRWEDPDG